MGYSLPPRQGSVGRGPVGRSPMGPSMGTPMADGPTMADTPDMQAQMDADAGGGGGGFGGVGLSAGRVGIPIPLPGFQTGGTGPGIRGKFRFADGGKIDGVAKKGKTKAKMVKMAKGGAVGASKRGDGIAKKGRTKGRIV